MAGVRAVSAVTRSFRCIRRIAGSFVFAESMLGRGFASPTRPLAHLPPKPAVVEFAPLLAALPYLELDLFGGPAAEGA